MPQPTNARIATRCIRGAPLRRSSSPSRNVLRSSTNLNRHIRQVHGEDAAGNNMGGSRPSRQ